MPKAELDHLLFGVPDLSAGMALIHARLGVMPVRGGPHPDVGTHNALLALGPRAYLEIIAPDPSQDVPNRDLPYGLAGLQAPRLITWAVRPADWKTHAHQTQLLGMETRLREGSRANPEGVQFHWQSAQPVPPVTVDKQNLTGLVPFAIAWQSSQHPATSAPGSLQLESLTLRYPSPSVLSTVVRTLELPCQVAFAPAAGLVARIYTEPGRVITLA